MIYYPYNYLDLQSVLQFLSGSLDTVGNLGFINIAFIVFKIVIAYLVLEKANERGWKSLIPIYKNYIEYKLYWNIPMFWLSFALPAIGILLLCLAAIFYNAMAIATVCVVIACICFIVGFCFKFSLQIKKAKCFGEAGSFAIGLILLNTIFVAILAFDKKCQYVGNLKEEDNNVNQDTTADCEIIDNQESRDNQV